MLEKIRTLWLYVQDLMDVRGDCIMMAFTSAMIARILMAGFGKAALSASEAAVYSAAIGAFAYSNKGSK